MSGPGKLVLKSERDQYEDDSHLQIILFWTQYEVLVLIGSGNPFQNHYYLSKNCTVYCFGIRT